MDEFRKQLIEEYVHHRQTECDWSEDEEDMTPSQRADHFRSLAQQLTNNQLVSANNSYSIAADG